MTSFFPAQRALSIWAALSDRIGEPTRTFKADKAKPGTLLGVWMQSGGYTVQHQDLAEALPGLRIVDPSVCIRVLADDRAWPCQAVVLSHDKPQENPTHLLTKNRLQPWPLGMVPARGYGDHQEAMALAWACAAQGCRLHHKMQSTGPQRESGSVVDRRQPG